MLKFINDLAIPGTVVKAIVCDGDTKLTTSGGKLIVISINIDLNTDEATVADVLAATTGQVCRYAAANPGTQNTTVINNAKNVTISLYDDHIRELAIKRRAALR